MRSKPQLEGQVALVTGASRGIGAAIAETLARNGADVAFTFASNGRGAEETENRIRSFGRKSLAIQADSADPDAVTAAVEQVVEAFGRIDILVNNAGIALGAPFEAATREEFDQTFAIHVRAPFFAAQAAARHMGEGGRIISIGSNLAERVALSGLSVYTASKSALTGMTRALARELGPRGITVNLVHPGSTDTDMNPADGPFAEPQVALTALGRYGQAEDVAASVLHLAGPGGRSITGTAILVDNGANA
ncbi:SDR family NAD(P)-dependent oxidoreductase [Devosia nitrariae]|uniref:3-ketoacyl-ACP reductase n=1 Tax=Devosia nitrariae TaxID=2071872 RepID=A0ABQ5W3D5_9HYPH|nr:SDR family oxidoreductase [Devosia nitrariae]GLQ54175.1 3-ketoacyl-ACP reductase [Devosia nitrariae]